MPSTPEIRTDSLSRKLYSTDASMYTEMPSSVAFPTNKDELSALVEVAKQQGISITARSAGTSLAGQTTGNGMIVDVSRHMTKILAVDVENKTAVVEPGVIRDSLNREAGKHQLIFGPDTSTTNRCMLGGMIGNNSSGSFSIRYGTTRDRLISLDTILSDGSQVHFGPLSNEQLEQKCALPSLEGKIYREMVSLIKEHKEAIIESFPHASIIRRNSGYAIDVLANMEPFTEGGEPFNMAKLLCGSEGTLALTSAAEVELTELEKYKVVLVPHYNSIRDALVSTVSAVKKNPRAVELTDDIILNATKGNLEQSRNRFFLVGEPKGILMIELSGNDLEDLKERATALQKELLTSQNAYACPILEDANEMSRAWDLRKAGLGLLMGLASDAKTPSFCEDTAVRVEDLPNYIDEFQAIVAKYETTCVYYAHASVGELHLRPVLNLKDEVGLQKMKDMADEIADLVAKYKGSISGEHGDGRNRAPYLEKIMGKEMVRLFEQVKQIWDPENVFNPNKIVFPKPIDEDLRFDPSYTRSDIPTVFKWKKELSLIDATEMCNGAGVCRKLAESGGTMCPSYMATKEEKDSTRGRANIFRQVFEGENPEAFASPELKEALELCLSCKSCKNECPANVDMARMKAEFDHGRHQLEGVSLTEQFFGEAVKYYPLAQRFATLSNFGAKSPLGKIILEKVLGVDKRRDLPRFERQTFYQWFKKNREQSSAPIDSNTVLLLADAFVNYHEKQAAIDALDVLEALGYNVVVEPWFELGRTHLSKGLLGCFKTLADKNIERLYPYAKAGAFIVGLEPSEILTLRDEYLDLFEGEIHTKAEDIAKQSFMIEEFVINADEAVVKEKFDAKEEVVYVHGHCHAKALTGMDPMLQSLKKVGYLPVDLKTGCCGMAGSFGYQKKNYELSMQIGELTLFPQVRALNKEEGVAAHGFSCRHQIKDGTGKESYHTSYWLKKALLKK